MIMETGQANAVRPWAAMLCLAIFLLILTGAWSLPFNYPSSSILYKFGTDRILLRSGKLVGISGGLLLLTQLLAVSHLGFLEKIFGSATLLRFHRINGLFLLLIFSHPLLIQGAYDFTFYTLEKKYLPEFLGVALLFCLALLVLSAWFRNRLPISYKAWRAGHRVGALLVTVLFFTHLLTVSGTFKKGLPWRLAILLAATEGILMLMIFGRALFPVKLK